jgi:N4-(beta-N-acetylglucosaminyl)-L-asparaginase
MPELVSRRGLLRAGLAGAVSGAAGSAVGAAQPGPAGRPVVISSGNGLATTKRAMEVLRDGGSLLAAVIAGVNLVEEDPSDHSVGYGGLPNEEGVVELDASVMYGPTHRAGAVAALRGVKTPSKVARLVMERTDHVLLVGEGARRFATAHGFPDENLLTDEAREMWLNWKETMSDEDDWIPADVPDAPAKQQSSARRTWLFTYGTINCNAVDADGNLAGVTTTSGLSYKLPGRVGDSPLIGCGLYVDNEVGAAGSTGRGEAVILENGSFSVVEHMRRGLAPREACLAVLQRMVQHNRLPRLLRQDGRPKFDVKFYALDKQGRYGAAAIWSGGKFAVCDAQGERLEECASLYPRPE